MRVVTDFTASRCSTPGSLMPTPRRRRSITPSGAASTSSVKLSSQDSMRPGGLAIQKPELILTGSHYQTIAMQIDSIGPLCMSAPASTQGETFQATRGHGSRDLTREAAFAVAVLVDATKQYGSGVGGRSCMALIINLGVPALTADKAWAKVVAEGLSVEMVRLKRTLSDRLQWNARGWIMAGSIALISLRSARRSEIGRPDCNGFDSVLPDGIANLTFSRS